MKKEKTWDDLFENISKVGEDFEDKKDLPIQQRENIDINLEEILKNQYSEASEEIDEKLEDFNLDGIDDQIKN
ncbi:MULTISPECIES: hypothetical protein [Francisella]|uniref:Uncharacterized protein n=1 Tax=Francisella marina TaxID=2249302 RepID=A0ABX5ZHR2_9GAMM|nr:hypothetical protein [Francisella marina]QEO57745.1 hypothetical protein F0R74_07715 [Francisella marina]QEO60029.1 hypothetical protein F0R75_09600 [Francisella marina]